MCFEYTLNSDCLLINYFPLESVNSGFNDTMTPISEGYSDGRADILIYHYLQPGYLIKLQTDFEIQ